MRNRDKNSRRRDRNFDDGGDWKKPKRQRRSRRMDLQEAIDKSFQEYEDEGQD